MYIDYSSWETYEYKIGSIMLDLSNPRLAHLGQVSSQAQILRALIEKEKVYELAKKISEEGYFVGEEPIICIEGNKKIVLEGNRRIAALKLLQNPTKYLPPIRARILQKNIISNCFDVNRKIRCHIAPNRLLANPIIYERHRGDAVQKWRTGNQYAFVAKMYNEGLSIEDICEVLNENRTNVLNPLKAYNLFIEGQEVLANRGVQIEMSTFDITNLERFCSLPEVAAFLGIQFNNDNGTLQIRLPRDEFENRLEVVFQAILESDNFSREYNKKENLIDLLGRIKSSSKVNMSINLLEEGERDENSKSEKVKKNLDEEKNKTTTRRKHKHKIQLSNAIISKEIDIYFGNKKLDDLFSELKSLPKEKIYSFGFLLRAYLEQSLSLYLKSNNLMQECTQHSAEVYKKSGMAKVKTLLNYIKKGENYSEEDINTCMNILKFNPSKEFSDIGLKQMLDYVVNHRIEGAFDTLVYKNIKDYVERIKSGLDLAIHNINTIVDTTHNERAWSHLYPLLKFFSENIQNE